MKPEYKKIEVNKLCDVKVVKVHLDNLLTGLGLGTILALIGLFGIILSEPKSMSSFITVTLACLAILYMQWGPRSIIYPFLGILLGYAGYWIYFKFF